VVVNENIPGRRRLLGRETIAINQFRKAIVVHRQVPRTDANARILPAFRNRLCADGLPASPERVLEFLHSLKLRLFSSANPETTAVKASSARRSSREPSSCGASAVACAHREPRHGLRVEQKKKAPKVVPGGGFRSVGDGGEGGCRPRTSHQCEMSPFVPINRYSSRNFQCAASETMTSLRSLPPTRRERTQAKGK
jgi:hypothetical protein